MIGASLSNVLLRTISLVGKFGIILYIGRFLSVETMGHYGLLVAAINMAGYLLGFEFYAFNTRLIVAGRKPVSVLIRDQLVVHAGIYTLTLPLLSLLFVTGLLSAQFALWFYLLLILEHLSQEAYRIFTALERPITANLILTIRTGGWCYVIIFLGIMDPSQRTFQLVLAGWTAGSAISLLLSVWLLARWLDWSPALRASVDWPWIRQGMRKSSLFFGSVVAAKSIQYIDRFFVEHFWGTEIVGVYTLYASIADAIQTFVFAGVIMILLPKLISAYQVGQSQEYGSHMKKLAIFGPGGAIALAFAAAATMPIILLLLEKPIYGDYLSTYWVLLGAAVVFVTSSIPHHGLYVRGLDRSILLAAAAAMLANLVLNILLVPPYGTFGAAVGTLVAAIVLVSSKTTALLLHKSRSS